MMVDGGPNPFREDLQQALDERGLRHMKYFLNTHYHDDHIDGLYQLLLNGFTADAYLHSYNDWAIRNSELGERTVKAAQKANVPVERILEGDTLSLGGSHHPGASMHGIHQYQRPCVNAEGYLRRKLDFALLRYYRPRCSITFWKICRPRSSRPI